MNSWVSDSSSLVVRYQQPAGKPLFQAMVDVASRRLHDLCLQGLAVAQQELAQGGIRVDLAGEVLGSHPQRGSGKLHLGFDERSVDACEQRHPEHAFATDHADLGSHAIFQIIDQRYHAGLEEVDGLDGRVRCVDHLLERENDGTELGQQSCDYVGRQGCQQAIAPGRGLRGQTTALLTVAGRECWSLSVVSMPVSCNDKRYVICYRDVHNYEFAVSDFIMLTNGCDAVLYANTVMLLWSDVSECRQFLLAGRAYRGKQRQDRAR